MDIYDSLFSPSCNLNEQVARHIFETIPRQGAIMVIVDREGHYFPSDSEEFSRLNVSDSFLSELCSKVDDGEEPVMTQLNDCTIVGAQLATERTNCGYVVLALPKYTPESALINIDLIDILLSEVSLIARLVEKNNLLYELQIKHFSNSLTCDPNGLSAN